MSFPTWTRFFYRYNHRISQRNLAMLSGISVTRIRRLETEAVGTADEYTKLAAAIGCAVSDII